MNVLMKEPDDIECFDTGKRKKGSLTTVAHTGCVSWAAPSFTHLHTWIPPTARRNSAMARWN